MPPAGGRGRGLHGRSSCVGALQMHRSHWGSPGRPNADAYPGTRHIHSLPPSPPSRDRPVPGCGKPNGRAWTTMPGQTARARKPPGRLWVSARGSRRGASRRGVACASRLCMTPDPTWRPTAPERALPTRDSRRGARTFPVPRSHTAQRTRLGPTWGPCTRPPWRASGTRPGPPRPPCVDHRPACRARHGTPRDRPRRSRRRRPGGRGKRRERPRQHGPEFGRS